MSTFFLLDENDLFKKLFQNYLELKGHRVVGGATDGFECMEKMRSFKTKPDFILINNGFSNDKSIEDLRKISKMEPTSKIIVIGYNDSEDELYSAGAKSYIKKPFNIDTFYKSIEKLTK
jgi:DNA-binding NarL/FixJ family response regulator